MGVSQPSTVSLRRRFLAGMGLAIVPLLFVGAGATIALERSLSEIHDVVEEASEELAVFLRLQVLLTQAYSAFQSCASPGLDASRPCDGFRVSRATVDAAFQGAATAPFGLPEERSLLDSARQHWQHAGSIGETILVVPHRGTSMAREFAAVDGHIDRAIEMLNRAHRLSEWEMAASLTSVRGTRRQTLLLIAAMFAIGLMVGVAGPTVLARSIMDPIEALERGAARLAGGDLKYRVPPSRYVELSRLGNTFNSMAATLEKSLAVLVHASVRDGLTGVYNYREFKRCLAVAVHRWRRAREPFDVLLIDLDRFKSINDTWGHQTGDEVLRCVGARLSQAVRPTDVVARYGGDEFAILLPCSSPGGAAIIAERARSLVSMAAAAAPTPLPAVTASIGIASCPDNACSEEQLVRIADSALYEAKRLGGNQARPASLIAEAEP